MRLHLELQCAGQRQDAFRRVAEAVHENEHRCIGPAGSVGPPQRGRDSHPRVLRPGTTGPQRCCRKQAQQPSARHAQLLRVGGLAFGYPVTGRRA